MKRLAVAASLALCAVVGGAASGCSAIAARDPGPIHCAMETPDPCPSLMHCVNELCVPNVCMMMPETCNGMDDDCNGMIDDNVTCPEGGLCLRGECRSDCAAVELCNNRDDDCDGAIDETLDVDMDGDGYVACSTTPGQSDCNDRAPMINPGETEVCNGFDDDCNPATTETMAGICGSGLQCLTPPGETVPRCVNIHDCRLFPCDSGQICNDSGGGVYLCCVAGTAGCGTVGDCRTTMPCTPPARCMMSGTTTATWSCVNLAPLGDPCTTNAQCESQHCYTRSSLDLTGSGGICGSACCTATDCTDEGTVCWAPGTGARSCVPSSVISSANHSYDLCTRTGGCAHSADGHSCVAHSVDLPNGSTGAAWTCSAAASGSCGGNTCASGVCDEVLGAYCVNPCGSDADCPSTRIGGVGYGCGYVSPASGQWITGCVVSGGNDGGMSCGNDRDCFDGLCLNSVCSATCCSDATCGSGTCGPVDHAGWEMRCIPPAT